MVYTLVLEASAERIESSSLSLRTTIWGMGLLGVDTCFASRIQIGSNPIFSTKGIYENTKTQESRCLSFDEAWRQWFTSKKPQAASWQMEAHTGRIT